MGYDTERGGRGVLAEEMEVAVGEAGSFTWG